MDIEELHEPAPAGPRPRRRAGDRPPRPRKEPRHGGAGHQRVQGERVVVEALRGAGHKVRRHDEDGNGEVRVPARSPRGARASREAAPDPAAHARERSPGSRTIPAGARRAQPALGRRTRCPSRRIVRHSSARRSASPVARRTALIAPEEVPAIGRSDDPALPEGEPDASLVCRLLAPPPAKTTPSFAPGASPPARASQAAPGAAAPRVSARTRRRPAVPLRTSGLAEHGHARHGARSAERVREARAGPGAPAPVTGAAQELVRDVVDDPAPRRRRPGVPQDLSPPEVLTGRSPPSPCHARSVASLCPSPGAARPRSS